MKQKIKFTNMTEDVSLTPPKPASNYTPDWYKKTESYMGGAKVPSPNGTLATVKRCMPVFDAITSGYIITSPSDVYVSFVDGAPKFQWSNHGAIDFHPIEQAPLHPVQNGFAYPKWINPWSIQTPKGYSVLIVHPMHRDLPFTILPGVVDTDQYTTPVNFPFVLNDPEFTGYIPFGTPIAQVVPFKRESWQSTFGGSKEKDNINRKTLGMSNFFYDKYKSLFRSEKSYK